MNTYSHSAPAPTGSPIADQVLSWLVAEGFTVTGSALSAVHGPDIIAHHSAKGTWRIVAKDGQAPFGEEQIAEGAIASFFAAAAMAEGQDVAAMKIGLALRRTPAAERQMSKVRTAMNLLGIVLLWVEPSGDVTVEKYRGNQEGLRPEELNASNDG